MFIRCRRSESTQLAISTCPSPIAWFNSQSIAISVPVLPTPALPQHHTRKHSRQTLLLICDALQSCIKYSGHKIFVTAQAGGSRRREGGMWGGGVSLPTGSGVWGGGCAPPPKFLDFWYQNGELLCILGGIIHRLAACFARKKKRCLWSSETKTYCCLRARRDGERQRQRKGKAEIKI